MSDPLETEPSPQLAAETATPSTPLVSELNRSAPDTKAEPQDDLASLLAQFDAATKPVDAPQVKPQEAPQPAGFDFDREMEKLSAWQKQHALEGQVKSLTAEVDAARQFIDRQHFEAAATAIEKRLSDFGLLAPEGYVKTALMAAAHNPEIAQAFDNRGQNPAAFTRVMRKLQDKIIADAKAMPDPEATGDRFAVVAAMRGATSKAIPERPPDYGSMNDAEFAKELAKHNI